MLIRCIARDAIMRITCTPTAAPLHLQASEIRGSATAQRQTAHHNAKSPHGRRSRAPHALSHPRSRGSPTETVHAQPKSHCGETGECHASAAPSHGHSLCACPAVSCTRAAYRGAYLILYRSRIAITIQSPNILPYLYCIQCVS